MARTSSAHALSGAQPMLERYFSVLLDEGSKFVRKDYGAEVWQGPPADAFSFWAGRVPAADSRRRPPIDDDMLLECFQRLEGRTEPAGENFRFVLALLLMRRKRFKLEEARNEDGREVLCLRCGRIEEYFGGPLQSMREQIETQFGFQIMIARTEVGGYCAHCQVLRAKEMAAVASKNAQVEPVRPRNHRSH